VALEIADRGPPSLCLPIHYAPENNHHPIEAHVRNILQQANNEDRGVMIEEISQLFEYLERCVRCGQRFFPEAYRRHVKRFF